MNEPLWSAALSLPAQRKRLIFRRHKFSSLSQMFNACFLGFLFFQTSRMPQSNEIWISTLKKEVSLKHDL